MEIYLSKYAGFCNGVKRAYDKVISLDLEAVKKPVYVLGSLVHNPDVIKKIEEKGIGRIDREDFFNAKPGQIGTLIVTAHGTGPDIFKVAQEKNINIIDTTCPKVIKVQRLAKAYARRGYKIVLVGDKGHKEVKGINEWGEGKAHVVSDESDLEQLAFFKDDKIVVISQTTQCEDFFAKVSGYIKEMFPESEIISTICNATHERQSEIRELVSKTDAVLIIGSKISANSTRLYEIAHAINPRTFFIENGKGLSSDWFSGVESVAVTAGASTPEWVIQEVLASLKKIR